MRRPLGVTILAVLTLIAAIAEWVWAATSGWGIERFMGGESWWISLIGPLARALLGLLYGLIGIGLWRLRKWARGAVIAISSLAIGGVVFNAILGQSLSLWLLLPVAGIYALCLSYMFTRKVRQAFSP